MLSEGRNRPAVSEILWLLETVSTAFRGIDTGTGTVQGKYFNKIAGELRRHHKGKILDQVLDWVTTLHGYLSSPTGGGVRHGADIKSSVDMQRGEAELYCNLIRRGWGCAWLRPTEGIRSTMEDDFELQSSELATLGQTGLELVPRACAATFAHSSKTWTIGCLTCFRREIHVRCNL